MLHYCRADARGVCFRADFERNSAGWPRKHEKTGQSPRSEAGVALVEMAICLPFILLCIAGLVNLASILFQLQVVADAARHGARVTAHLSNFQDSCFTLELTSSLETERFLQQYALQSSHFLASMWGVPQVTRASKSWDGVAADTISVRLDSTGATCLFCLDGLLGSLSLSSGSTFVMERTCTAP